MADDNDDLDKSEIRDARTAETKNLDALAAEAREIDCVYHATSDSTGDANWLGVALDYDWDHLDEAIPIPEQLIRLTASNRWTLTDVYSEYESGTERYVPMLTFRPVELVVGADWFGDSDDE